MGSRTWAVVQKYRYRYYIHIQTPPHLPAPPLGLQNYGGNPLPALLRPRHLQRRAAEVARAAVRAPVDQQRHEVRPPRDHGQVQRRPAAARRAVAGRPRRPVVQQRRHAVRRAAHHGQLQAAPAPRVRQPPAGPGLQEAGDNLDMASLDGEVYRSLAGFVLGFDVNKL